MRSYAFTRLQALGRTPELEETLDAQASKLAARLAPREDDEVLVVGHSSGAIMAASIVARAVRLRRAAGDAAPALSLLTLGQSIPMLAGLPQAQSFRTELIELGHAPGLHWIDFSAPPDASCMPLSNPLAEADVLGTEAPAGVPKLLSPRFAAMFDPAGYRVLRKDKLRMHFQYLMAAAQPVEYDYFRITAGARTLAERFAHLASVTDFDTLRPFRRRVRK
jgi:pimeloyl-ACP methyl ester carboxylesterase